ncbi:2Fe-2S iron-sulfur cluster-binding protein, partial [Halorubrum lacusprofundi]|uniref:2Fe-2S iron-sulfur cluster-binding protein n=1 Tax=Halorubrum lacusprofundi TaxID=2247 RepID=UPI001F0A2E29
MYNGRGAQFNCRGTGSCGTCAVQVDGSVSEPGKNLYSLLFLPPPHPIHVVLLASLSPLFVSFLFLFFLFPSCLLISLLPF